MNEGRVILIGANNIYGPVREGTNQGISENIK